MNKSTPTSSSYWLSSSSSSVSRPIINSLVAAGPVVYTTTKNWKRSLCPHASVMIGILLAIFSFTWLGVEFAKPAKTPVKQTLHKPRDVLLFIGLALSAVAFSSLHCVRLARAHRRYGRSPFATAGLGVITPQDQYVLRTVVCQLMGTATLIATYRGDLTPHLMLTWEPVLLSGALILNAAYEGRECPVDVELG
ncbi:MAG: hypothetical protein Q9162_002385 [Coniocarpon cinnabarinum]